MLSRDAVSRTFLLVFLSFNNVASRIVTAFAVADCEIAKAWRLIVARFSDDFKLKCNRLFRAGDVGNRCENSLVLVVC